MTEFRGILSLNPVIDAKGHPVTTDGRTLWRHGLNFGFRDITVQAGETTDLASIPRLVWSIFPPDGPWVEAAVIHDHLYRTHGEDGKYTRAQADRVLLDAMADLGISAWQRYSIYYAVRVGGWKGWGN